MLVRDGGRVAISRRVLSGGGGGGEGELGMGRSASQDSVGRLADQSADWGDGEADGEADMGFDGIQDILAGAREAHRSQQQQHAQLLTRSRWEATQPARLRVRVVRVANCRGLTAGPARRYSSLPQWRRS